MKDASHTLNSGLVFSSSSRKCQVFKMICCHAVRWGRRATWKWSEGGPCAPGAWSRAAVALCGSHAAAQGGRLQHPQTQVPRTCLWKGSVKEYGWRGPLAGPAARKQEAHQCGPVIPSHSPERDKAVPFYGAGSDESASFRAL